jgi:methionyl-tRNA formyltransferase
VRIAFFGLPLAAVLLARDGHDIVYAAACRRPALGLRRLATRVARGRTHVRPNVTSDSTFVCVRDAAPELVVSWFWTTKLPARILGLAPAVGVHPSLLPRHRGPDPCFWAIDSGDQVTGVTAHVLDVEYDTGDILGRSELRIDPTWNAWDLARALDRPSLGLLRDVVRSYADGRPPPAIAQDERSATTAAEPSEDDLAIRWAWPAVRVEWRVRAAAPWPGAWTEIGDTVVTLLRVRVTSDYPRALAPAEAAVRPDGVAVVRAGEGAVELLEGRGYEEDVPLSWQDFARLVAGARVT